MAIEAVADRFLTNVCIVGMGRAKGGQNLPLGIAVGRGDEVVLSGFRLDVEIASEGLACDDPTGSRGAFRQGGSLRGVCHG